MELEAILLERHLGRCAACRGYAEDAERHTDLLRATELEEMPGRVPVPLQAPARRRVHRGVVVAAVGLTAVAASVSLTIGSRRNPPLGAPTFTAAAPVLQDDSLGVMRAPVRRRSDDSAFMRGELGLPA